jgi:hypothetical protein
VHSLADTDFLDEPNEEQRRYHLHSMCDFITRTCKKKLYPHKHQGRALTRYLEKLLLIALRRLGYLKKRLIPYDALTRYLEKLLLIGLRRLGYLKKRLIPYDALTRYLKKLLLIPQDAAANTL